MPDSFFLRILVLAVVIPGGGMAAAAMDNQDRVDDPIAELKSLGVPVEFRDDTEDTAYALKNIRKDARGRYWLHSWNRQFNDLPVVHDQIFPFARYICKVGKSD